MPYDVAVLLEVPADGRSDRGATPAEREQEPRFHAGEPPSTTTATTAPAAPVVGSAGPAGSLPITGVDGALVLVGVLLLLAGLVGRLVAR